MNLLIFGPQGSGKGTQADILAERFNLAHIETGQIFRDMALEDNELGRKIRELNERKEMVPDEITLGDYHRQRPAHSGTDRRGGENARENR